MWASIFYENDTLKFINHEEGRIVTTAATPEYQYFLKDHLGNVRMTFTTKKESDTALATLEDSTADVESSQFLNYDEAVKVYSTLFDHTNDGLGQPPSGPVGNPDEVDDTVPGYATLLRGSHNGIDERYGLAKSLSVMPGDTIKMEVFAKYIAITQTDIATNLADVLAAIGNPASGHFIDGGIGGSLGAAAFPFPGLLTHNDEPQSEAPKAYLNWLIFDRDRTLIDAGFRPVTTAGAETGTGMSQHDYLADTVVIQQAGYVYIYLSNEDENSVDVFFDDFRVEHVKGPVVQVGDYYPFGLTFNEYRRENCRSNQYTFNGKEEQEDLDLGWLDYGARMYIPELGRWGVADPLGELYEGFSPYHYAINNPVNFADPNGMNSESIHDLIQSAWNSTPAGGNSTYDSDGNCTCGCPGKPPCEGEEKAYCGRI